jgi:hypothetical protein
MSRLRWVGDYQRPIREPRQSRVAAWRKRKVSGGLLLYLVRTARGHEKQQAQRDPSRLSHEIEADLASATSRAPGRQGTAEQRRDEGVHTVGIGDDNLALKPPASGAVRRWRHDGQADDVTFAPKRYSGGRRGFLAMPFLERDRQSARIASATHISASPEEGVERAAILAEP